MQIPDRNTRRIIAIGFAIAAIMVLFFSWRALEYEFAARSWPEVEGTVVNAFTEEVGSSNGEVHPVLVINYNFTYGGKTYGDFYRGTHLITVSSNREEIADALSYTDDLASQYRPGDKIMVRVNPSYPEQTSIYISFMQNIGKELIWPVIFLIVAAAIMATTFV